MAARQNFVLTLVILLNNSQLATLPCHARTPQCYFKDVMNVGPIGDVEATEFAPFVSPDGYTLYFSRSAEFGQQLEGGQGGEDMWFATRTDLNAPFENISNLGARVNSSANEHVGSVSPNGLELYFGSNRSGNTDMYRAIRKSNQELFDNVVPLGPGVNTEMIEGSPRVSADGLTLVYQVAEEIPVLDMDIWMAIRRSEGVPFGDARRLEMNTDDVSDWWPSLSSDQLTLFVSDWVFNNPRPGGAGEVDIWVSTRATPQDQFSTPVNLDELWGESNLNTFQTNGAAYISSDWPASGSRIYYMGTGPGPTSGPSDIFQATWVSLDGLQAGDADQDLDFDQFDLVQVQIAGKYLTTQTANWAEGDWDGAPGGEPGNPPLGNGKFDQTDVIAALGAGKYLTGPYTALQARGNLGDGQTSVIYNSDTGQIAIDAPAGVQLTSINIDAASGIFSGDAAANLGGSFDNDADTNIFKATFGGSFGSVSFGNVAQVGLTEDFVLGDLSVVGSLAGGGDLGNVDLVYVTEPTSALLLAVGLALGLAHVRRVNR